MHTFLELNLPNTLQNPDSGQTLQEVFGNFWFLNGIANTIQDREVADRLLLCFA